MVDDRRNPLAFCVYLAGPMPNDPELDENVTAQWRQGIVDLFEAEFNLAIFGIKVMFFCPEFVGKPHDSYDWTVDADLEMIEKSHLIFALVDQDDREGTFAEIGYAKGLGRPILALYEVSTKGGDWRGSFTRCMCQHTEDYYSEQPTADIACAAAHLIRRAILTLAAGPDLAKTIQTDHAFLESWNDRVHRLAHPEEEQILDSLEGSESTEQL